MTNVVQQRVLALLRAAYPTTQREFMFYVQPTKDYNAGEPSMRSRSFLFLSRW